MTINRNFNRRQTLLSGMALGLISPFLSGCSGATPIDTYSGAREAVSNLDTSPDVLDQLSLNRNKGIRRRVAFHPNASVKSLRQLGADEDWSVRLEVLGNPKTPEDVINRLATSVAPLFINGKLNITISDQLNRYGAQATWRAGQTAVRTALPTGFQLRSRLKSVAERMPVALHFSFVERSADYGPASFIKSRTLYRKTFNVAGFNRGPSGQIGLVFAKRFETPFPGSFTSSRPPRSSPTVSQIVDETLKTLDRRIDSGSSKADFETWNSLTDWL